MIEFRWKKDSPNLWFLTRIDMQAKDPNSPNFWKMSIQKLQQPPHWIIDYWNVKSNDWIELMSYPTATPMRTMKKTALNLARLGYGRNE